MVNIAEPAAFAKSFFQLSPPISQAVKSAVKV
jgi:hypothetical protein